MTRRLPRYPVYIPSKGRAEHAFTARCLRRDGVPFRLVVEEQERAAYAAAFGEESLLVLPFKNRGLHAARNWIKAHATAEGWTRHWQLDDNISDFYRWWRGNRLYCRAGIGLRVTEDFVDRYENVAIAGLNYVMFAIKAVQPFTLNAHVYSATLVLNSLPNRWRSRYNDDTDLCLQVLADGWCTVLMNAFLVQKKGTMVIPGGNEDIYKGDGRLRMARTLERLWPNVVKVDRRWRRPQHVVAASWKKFDTPLRRKPGVRTKEGIDDYGMTLKQVGSKVKSERLKRLLTESKRSNA